ncbi:MAG: hypothetical protein HDQ87_09025 [Clostridia bacterium]|nr:hypothetical protein [Clostridia bacterium]
MENAEKKIVRIIVTGGTAERRLAVQEAANEYLSRGYTIFMVPNSMEELERAGVTPEALRSPAAFVSACLDLQLANEYVFFRAAAMAEEDRILIICDGGTMDSTALLSSEERLKLLEQLGVSLTSLRDGGDAVFFVGSPAAQDGLCILDAWAGHPHLRIIDAEGPGAARERLIAETDSVIGEPEPLEIERRFLIDYPDMDWLASQSGCAAVEIEQAYLSDPDGEDVRLRKRGAEGGYIYYETIKRGEGATRSEVERRISEAEYTARIREAGSGVRWIRKTRYCLVYQGQYLEIDVYPFWNDQAVVEAELLREDAEVALPPEIRVREEITGNPEYSNYALSRPDESR